MEGRKEFQYVMSINVIIFWDVGNDDGNDGEGEDGDDNC